jgi:alpha-D-ribose 1-methylphosphonate 5-triphosphate diphosphatase PhnM
MKRDGRARSVLRYKSTVRIAMATIPSTKTLATQSATNQMIFFMGFPPLVWRNGQ